jgi:hypothetical protein
VKKLDRLALFSLWSSCAARHLRRAMLMALRERRFGLLKVQHDSVTL